MKWDARGRRSPRKRPGASWRLSDGRRESQVRNGAEPIGTEASAKACHVTSPENEPALVHSLFAAPVVRADGEHMALDATVFRSVALFILAGLAEIGGGYLV